MPRTKKQSYAKSRQHQKETRRSLRKTATSSVVVPEPIIIDESDDNEEVDVAKVLLERQKKIAACITDVERELDDDCIAAFFGVVTDTTPFKPQDTLFYQRLKWYKRVTTSQDIQILYSGNIGPDEIGHWTCIYYDGSVVHVYDTLHMQLVPLQRRILNRLYTKYSIVYEDVQIQPDEKSCGVFACAIATSLALGINPVTQNYLVDDDEERRSTKTMRQHLMRILNEKTLTPFPTMNVLPLTYSTVSQENKRTYASVCNTKLQPSIINTRLEVGRKMSDSQSQHSSAERIRQIDRQDNGKTYASVCKTTPQPLASNNRLVLERITLDSESQHSSGSRQIRQIDSITVNTKDQSVKRMIQPKTAQKKKWWAEHKDEINKRKRMQYKGQKANQQANIKAEEKKKKKRKIDTQTSKTQDVVKHTANHTAEQSSPENKSHIVQSIKRKAQKREWYTAHAPAIKNKKKAKYALNAKVKEENDETKYATHTKSHKKLVKSEQKKPAEQKTLNKKARTTVDPTTKKTLNTAVHDIRQELKGHRKYLQTANIVKKYRGLGRRTNTIPLLGSVETFVGNLSSKLSRQPTPESRIEAQRIVKWCIQARKEIVLGIAKTLNNLKQRIDVCTIQAAESSDVECKIAAFCGESKHTGSSDPYYTDTAYNELDSPNEPLITEATGRIVNILPVTATSHIRKSWVCSEMCIKPDEHTITRLEHLFRTVSTWKISNIRNNLKNFNVCSVNNTGLRLGHSESCYRNLASCRSKILPLLTLQSHFTQIRYFTRQIYELMRLVKKINSLDDALRLADLGILKTISFQAAQKASIYKTNTEQIDLDEDRIIDEHSRAFHDLVKRSMDTPKWPCISCEKLCYKRNVVAINRMRKPISGRYWSELQEHVTESEFESGNICHYCLDKFRRNELPPTCILNNLTAQEPPEVLSGLNAYGKILIQRFKAFQTIHAMTTVAKKKLPHNQKIKKVVGRTFHLPLPLEETLKKLPNPTDPLNRNQELFVMVCGLPNKSKVVWSKLVDINKIYETLVWLKRNNPFYAEIELPASPEMLLDSLTQEVEIQIENNEMEFKQSEELPIDGTVEEDEVVRRKAMLTQIIDTDEYYEQYTIYPIHADRENKTDTAMYQMLKVEEAPLSNWDKKLDIMCFPDLYPYGNGGQHEERIVRLRECDFIKVKLMSKHSAYRLNQQYLFYLLNDSNIRQLRSGIFSKLNVINPKEKMNAGEYLELMSREQLEGNLTTVFARLRNTEQYWRRARNNLGCMVQSYGPATWFLTLSPSEWMWEDLAAYIREVNGPSMANMSTSELVATDPVSTSRYLDNKFHSMLDFICSTDNPIGKVAHYFWRREYQGRGTQHFHLLIWIENAPTIGESTTDEVVEFITKYITCRLPDKNISPTLHRRVDTHQRHTHNDYCMRNKKTKKGFSKICRFGFPRPVTESVTIRDVAVSIANRKQLKAQGRLYDLTRSHEEMFINDYNPVILTAWEGNMDMQFIGEKSTILNWYCTRYSTKTETSHATEMFDNINSTKSLSSRLWSIALRSLNNRECGALEAADTLLGISLYGTDPDTTIKWLDVNQIRNRRVKPYKAVDKLHPESTDIFYPSLIDDHYPNRPEELDPLNLYDYAKWYEITKVLPTRGETEIYELGGGMYLKKRKRGYLINHYKYNPSVEPEKYFHALLLLFRPWRDTDELKANYDSYAEAFEKCQEELVSALEYHERLCDIQKGLDHVKELIEQKLNDVTDRLSQLSQESNDGIDNPLGYQPVEANLAMNEFNNVAAHEDEVDVSDLVSQLNDEQEIIFDKVMNTFLADNDEVLRLFVSGAGGTGKSFLIKTIRCWTKQILGKTTAVTAPTGLAAFNIDGLTVHRLFQLPIEHGRTPKYKELSDQVLKILRQQLKDVVLFIIDEVSMISNITLTYIHLRLCEIFDTKNTEDGWFGGKHIILMGDLLQLPPVNEDSAYMSLSKEKVRKYVGSVGTINLWTHLFEYDELLTNVRQQNDSTYQEILSRVRFGIMTTEDQLVLESRKVKLVGESVSARREELCDFINRLPVDTVCLFPKRNQCDTLNRAMLERVPGEEIELNAKDSVDCIPYLKKKISKLLNQENEDSSRTAGLAKTIVIKIGAKIMIRRNIDVSIGLINGTIAHVISVTRDLDTREIKSLTIALASGTEYTIDRVSTKFEIMNGAFIHRDQFPVSLSYGITIHKSQGLTLNNVVMDIGSTLFTCGQAYVALSRVRSLEGLHLINFNPQSIKVQELALIEYNRLRKRYKPELSEINITREKYPKVKDTVWSVPSHIQKLQTEITSTTLQNCSQNVVGIRNVDGVSCYANATLQCIFHCPVIVRKLIKLTNNDSLETMALSYVTNAGPMLNSLSVREYAGEQFTANVEQDAAEFLMALCEKSDILCSAIEHQLTTSTRCNSCKNSSETTQPNRILAIPVTYAAKVKKNLSPTKFNKRFIFKMDTNRQ